MINDRKDFNFSLQIVLIKIIYDWKQLYCLLNHLNIVLGFAGCLIVSYENLGKCVILGYDQLESLKYIDHFSN